MPPPRAGSRTSKILVEAQSLVYMSPEALSDSRKVTEASDVFSLGAIAFHLFASRPPASNPTELAKILRDQKGLSISSVLDGAGPKLEELIQWSTHPTCSPASAPSRIS